MVIIDPPISEFEYINIVARTMARARLLGKMSRRKK